MLEIKADALFIADSHYPHHGDDFIALLKALEKGKCHASQLFLMGDNFDLLFGHNDYIQSFSHKAITLLQRLSLTLEIFYFEGNHDFCLAEIFPNIKVYTREEQPQFFRMGKQTVALSHGDKYATGMGYNLYSKLLRNKKTLMLLKPWEKSIIDQRMQKLSQKHICHTFKGFEKRVEKIISSYSAQANLIIEGHFHQGMVHKHYISLPSLACQRKIGLYREGKIQFVSLSSYLP